MIPAQDNVKLKNGSVSTLALTGLLFSRTILFAVFQALIALFSGSWTGSGKYWMLTATLTNFVSLFFLYRLFRMEGKNFFSLYRFDKSNLKNDLWLFLAILLVLVPLTLLPNYFLSIWLWNDPMYPVKILFQPVSFLMIISFLVFFPVSIAFAELPTYFGYIMPQLEKRVKKNWLAVLLPVIFISIQHCTLPLVFEGRFILYRGLMYLPFALTIGIALWKRPGLLPWFVILHGLMDLQAVVMLIIETGGE